MNEKKLVASAQGNLGLFMYRYMNRAEYLRAYDLFNAQAINQNDLIAYCIGIVIVRTKGSFFVNQTTVKP